MGEVAKSAFPLFDNKDNLLSPIQKMMATRFQMCCNAGDEFSKFGYHAARLAYFVWNKHEENCRLPEMPRKIERGKC